jgi:tRNA dimethylallyltransferase
MNQSSIFIAGPTASGKSSVAMELAAALHGEIIVVDSMQVYRGLNIGTAKPLPADRTRIPHHLIDVVDLADSFDAAKFIGLAKKAEAEILQHGKIPVFCGGTGLYFKALLCGIGDATPPNRELRQSLEQLPISELQQELKQKDPATYSAIDLQNPRRLIRAIEVIRTTGRPFSELRSDWTTHQTGFWFGLERSREDLNQRINSRVDQMLAAGLLDETRTLLQAGLESNPVAMQAIGYRQVVEHLCGLRGLEETVELIKLKTRQFARRQMTWFRRQLKLQRIPVTSDESPPEICRTILNLLKTHPPRP